MTRLLLPAIWLLVLIAGLPQLSETVYSPSLPEIADALNTSESMVEYTLTIYLFGFAIGTLFWGKLSDQWGRKSSVLGGLIIFILGCIGCYFSSSIEMLMLSRLVQAFGGSIGSVLGQAICRDAFLGPDLGKVYSVIGSALAVFPAIGPLVGGLIAQFSDWSIIFLFLLACAVILTLLVGFYLPETHHVSLRKSVSIIDVALNLLKDRRVMGFALIVAACNGICFSYFAEGSFFLIKNLGLSPSQYGASFMLIAASTMLGGMLSKKLHAHLISKTIMEYGLMLIALFGVFFSVFTLMYVNIFNLSNYWMIGVTILSQMGIMFGVCMATSNALALALVDYKHCIGTASSLFGFFYYALISLFTLGMGLLHNGTLLPMPLYFMGLAFFMLLVRKLLIH